MFGELWKDFQEGLKDIREQPNTPPKGKGNTGLLDLEDDDGYIDDGDDDMLRGRAQLPMLVGGDTAKEAPAKSLVPSLNIFGSKTNSDSKEAEEESDYDSPEETPPGSPITLSSRGETNKKISTSSGKFSLSPNVPEYIDDYAPLGTFFPGSDKSKDKSGPPGKLELKRSASTVHDDFKRDHPGVDIRKIVKAEMLWRLHKGKWVKSWVVLLPYCLCIFNKKKDRLRAQMILYGSTTAFYCNLERRNPPEATTPEPSEYIFSVDSTRRKGRKPWYLACDSTESVQEWYYLVKSVCNGDPGRALRGMPRGFVAGDISSEPITSSRAFGSSSSSSSSYQPPIEQPPMASSHTPPALPLPSRYAGISPVPIDEPSPPYDNGSAGVRRSLGIENGQGPTNRYSPVHEPPGQRNSLPSGDSGRRSRVSYNEQQQSSPRSSPSQEEFTRPRGPSYSERHSMQRASFGDMTQKMAEREDMVEEILANQQQLIKEGYLWKRGALNKNWKRRYFTLHPLSLAYFESKNGKKLKELSITVGDEHSVQLLPPQEVKLGKVSAMHRLLSLTTKDRNLMVIAETYESAVEWETVLSAACIAAKRQRDSLRREADARFAGLTGFERTEGWLQKKGHYRQNWTTRYFMLARDALRYYKTKEETTGSYFLGEIRFEGLTIASVEVLPEDQPKTGTSESSQWRFAIRGKERRLILAAPSQEDMIAWANSIKKAIALLKTTV